MPRRTPLSSLLALPAAVASLLAVACAGPSTPPAAPGAGPATPVASGADQAAASAAGDATLSGIDVLFLTTMAAHSERTLKIVRLARDRVTDAELRTMAAAIEVTEADELATMRGWLPTAGPASAAAGHHHAGHGDDGALDRLRAATGADVDTVLREVLADHQRSAAQLARAQVDAGRSERVRDLARRIERSRTAEVDLLTGPPAPRR